MERRTTVIAGATVAFVLTGGGMAAGRAGEDRGEGADVPITGAALERAGAVALAYTGGGTVTETEVGDEESYYEVEVRLPGGGQIDVQLDEQFAVVGSDADDEPDDD